MAAYWICRWRFYVKNFPTPALFSTTDTITIWIGILGVMVALASLIVTAAGIGVAVLGLFGYQKFVSIIPDARVAATIAAEEKAITVATFVAKESANQTAREVAESFLQTTDFSDMLKRQVTDNREESVSESRQTFAKQYTGREAKKKGKDVS